MQINLLITSVLSLSILASCGKSSNTDDFEPNFTTPTIAQNPVLLKKEDLSCVRVFSSQDNPIFFIQQFIAGNTESNFYSFGGQLRDNYVESVSINEAPISESTFNDSSELVITVGYNRSTQQYSEINSISPKSATKGEKLFVCPSGKYTSQSFEGAGLNISYSISKTYKAIQSADPTIKLDPVKLHVAPEHKQLFRLVGGPSDRSQIYYYQTDNAYYDPSAKAISFLPQSEEYQARSGTTPFWEIPMVASHEYGHHIFSTLISKKISHAHTFSKGCFKNNVTSRETIKLAAGERRDNSVNFALGAMNEGFADLIAYYSLGVDERKLTGVSCFEKMREVGSSKFGDNYTKEFSVNAVETMNSATVVERYAARCTIPNYQEIHDVGALFAYGVNKLISRVTVSKEAKLKIVLKWAKTLKDFHNTIKSLPPADYIFANMEKIYSLALIDSKITLASSHCSHMNTVFTGNQTMKCRYLK